MVGEWSSLHGGLLCTCDEPHRLQSLTCSPWRTCLPCCLCRGPGGGEGRGLPSASRGREQRPPPAQPRPMRTHQPRDQGASRGSFSCRRRIAIGVACPRICSAHVMVSIDSSSARMRRHGSRSPIGHGLLACLVVCAGARGGDRRGPSLRNFFRGTCAWPRSTRSSVSQRLVTFSGLGGVGAGHVVAVGAMASRKASFTCSGSPVVFAIFAFRGAPSSVAPG